MADVIDRAALPQTRVETDNIQRCSKQPDCLLGEISQPSDSQLSETTTSSSPRCDFNSDVYTEGLTPGLGAVQEARTKSLCPGRLSLPAEACPRICPC